MCPLWGVLRGIPVAHGEVLMLSSTSRVVLFFALSSALSFGQSSGGGGTAGGGTSGGSTGGGGSRGTTTSVAPSTRGNGRNIPNVQDEQQRPIILSGRVVMDDGNPPSERVSVERVCNGRARRETYTDSKGYFTITINNRQPMMVMQDASVGSEGIDPAGRPGGMGSFGGFGSGSSDISGSNSLNGCELRAVLATTTSDTVQLTGRRAFDDPNVGTIVLHRLGKTGGATVSLTSLQAPDKAKKAFEHAMKAMQKQKLDEAKSELNKAVEIYPAYAEAWADLSDIYLKGSEFDNARMAAEKSIAADAHYVRPYFTLIVLTASKEDWKGTLDLSDKLLGLDAFNYPAAYYYNALANYRLHDLEKAEKSLRMARKLDSTQKLPKISLLMGTVLMDRNDYAGAVEQFQAFLTHAPDGADAQYARDAITFSQNKLASASAPKP